jgi:hypothetical protein
MMNFFTCGHPSFCITFLGEVVLEHPRLKDTSLDIGLSKWQCNGYMSGWMTSYVATSCSFIVRFPMVLPSARDLVNQRGSQSLWLSLMIHGMMLQRESITVSMQTLLYIVTDNHWIMTKLQFKLRIHLARRTFPWSGCFLWEYGTLFKYSWTCGASLFGHKQRSIYKTAL